MCKERTARNEEHCTYRNAGAGKSTVGVILAKVMGMNFIDSDLLIQKKEGMLLKDIIEKKGLQGYIDIENEVNRAINADNTVIATGEASYTAGGHGVFRNTANIVYIRLSYETISKGSET